MDNLQGDNQLLKEQCFEVFFMSKIENESLLSTFVENLINSLVPFQLPATPCRIVLFWALLWTYSIYLLSLDRSVYTFFVKEH